LAISSSEPSRIALLEDPGPYLIPAGILAEVTYLTERRLGMSMLEGFVLDLEEGGFSLECGEEDLPRVRELVRRYADLALGFADASVIACAERVSGGRVLTLDRCPFGAVAREGRITLLPAKHPSKPAGSRWLKHVR
jgi:uncharacterized protein